MFPYFLDVFAHAFVLGFFLECLSFHRIFGLSKDISAAALLGHHYPDCWAAESNIIGAWRSIQIAACN